MAKVYVVGVGMTKFEFAGVNDNDYPALAKEALEKALDDAKVSYPQIEKVFVSFVYGESTCGQRAIYETGMTGIPIFNVNNNCVSGATALLLAKESIEHGINDCVLALGFEKMQKGRLKIMYKDRVVPLDKHFQRLKELTKKSKTAAAAVMMGGLGEEHMNRYGSKLIQFAKIAHKNYIHAMDNPYSQSQKNYTINEILKSRRIYGPLTKLQCCQSSDGAAAAIFASERFVLEHGLQEQAVEVLGMEMHTDVPNTLTGDIMTLAGCHMSRLAANKVFRKTLINPTDVDVVELHDCFSVHELVLYEMLGLCAPGKGGELVDQNNNTYGGKYVVNPSGGLIGKGHPLGATGIAQCAELCWQLRGEAGKRQVKSARLALQHNYGWGAAAVVALYSKGFAVLPFCYNTIIDINRNNFKIGLILLIRNLIMNDQHNLFYKFIGSIQFKVERVSGCEDECIIRITGNSVSMESYDKNEKPDITLRLTEENLDKIIVNSYRIQTVKELGFKECELQRAILQHINPKSKL